MTGERFVRTRAIQAAVRGHETEILAALGISPNGGAHIHCPFPDHVDVNSSWRWDERKARAFCTCTNGHALSVFHVLGRLEGIDFEAAKIRTAELISRADLIEEKGAGGQKMTAERLLAPPAARSVPELPRMYLAAGRLGVDPDHVPMPTTPVAGWLNLEYWDPPTKKRGKPRLVGRHPCAVFGTIAPDGRTHAHRIYVQPSGRGRAELGGGRNPKKSAVLRKGETATGCAVLWGNPDRAPWLLVAEGIETAAAIAFAFKAEIGADEVCIAAAMSKAGVAGIEPWPATKRMTACADRDEAKPKGTPGYRDGEIAARQLAARHRDLDVTIALPGKPGTKTDWLNVLLADGPDAVRAGIVAAEAPVLTSEDQSPAAAPATAAKREGILAQQGKFVRLFQPFKSKDGDWLAPGVYLEIKEEDPETHEEKIRWAWFASQLDVLADTRNAISEQWGRLLVIEDPDGQKHEWSMPMAMLAGRGDKYRAILLSLGLQLAPSAFGRNSLHEYITLWRPGAKMRCVERVGWNAGVFVLPDRVFGEDPSGKRVLLQTAGTVPTFTIAGSL